jgi:exonuclease SbcC
MLIKKIKLENIRSYENQEIEFPKGSILLSGDIGSGKTSILLAIEFALFGLQPSQRGSSLLKNGKKEGKVILELEIDNKPVILERTLRRGKTISQEDTSIIIDNEKFEGSVTEIKNRVLRLLNYPLEFAKKTNLLYKFTVYTPQEEMKQIILESAETRLNTLRHIFGIDKYKRIEENVSLFTSKLREEIRNKEGQLVEIDEIKKNLKKKKNMLALLQENQEKENKVFQEKTEQRKKIETEATELEKKVKEKENLEKEKEKSNIMLINKKESSLELNIQIEKLKIELEEGKELVFDEKKLQEIIEIIGKNKEQEKNLQEEIINFSSRLNSLIERKKEAAQLREKLSKLQSCPTCLQEVNEQYKENIFQKIDSELLSINKEAHDIEKQKLQFSGSLESLRKQTASLEQKKSDEEIKKIKLQNIKEKEKNTEEIEKRKKQIDSDVEMMSKQIKVLEESIEQFSKFTFLFENKQKELEQEKLKEKEQEIKIAEINKEISLAQEQILDIETNLKEKEKLKKKIDYLKSLENWLSDKFLSMILFTEKNIMLKLREEFSALFSEWFSVLVPESLSVRLDEQFSPIIGQQDYELSYNYLSGGERTAVALAYRLALNQVINSLLSKIKTRDLIILDEPTDGFSETQLDKMRDVLAQLKIAQLVLVSHEAKIESFVENIIKFKKEEGVTKVEG